MAHRKQCPTGLPVRAMVLSMGNEDHSPEAGRDLGPLIHALRRHGGTLSFARWVSVPESMTINLHLPDDEARAEQCRLAIEDWRKGE